MVCEDNCPTIKIHNILESWNFMSDISQEYFLIQYQQKAYFKQRQKSFSYFKRCRRKWSGLGLSKKSLQWEHCTLGIQRCCIVQINKSTMELMWAVFFPEGNRMYSEGKCFFVMVYFILNVFKLLFQ